MTGYLENEEITVGRPLVIAIDVTADTTDNTLLLSSDYDANGDGSAESCFSGKKLIITGLEVNAGTMTGEFSIVIDDKTTIYRKDLSSAAISDDEVTFGHNHTFGKFPDVFSQITVKKSAAPAATSKVYVYALISPQSV